MKDRIKYKNIVKGIISHLILLCGAFIMISPILWLISSAFKPENEMFSKSARLLPETVTLQNFVRGWHLNPEYSFLHFAKNTLFICIMDVIGILFSCTLAAFAFSRMRFKLRNILMMVMISTMVIPSQILIIPKYLIFKGLGWLGNSYLPLIVPAFIGGNAFYIFMLIQFMRGIPKELDESATIDGCGVFRIYRSIIMPLCTPALVTVVIFTFLGTWDDFFSQLIYIGQTKRFTISLIIRTLMDSTSVSWGPLMALSIVTILPNIILFFIAQPYFVEGIATKGLKG